MAESTCPGTKSGDDPWSPFPLHRSRWVCAWSFRTWRRDDPRVAKGCTMAFPSSHGRRGCRQIRRMRIHIFLLFTSSCAEGVRRSSGKDAVPRPACSRNGPSNPVPSNTACRRFHVTDQNPALPPKAGYDHCLPSPRGNPQKQSQLHPAGYLPALPIPCST